MQWNSGLNAGFSDSKNGTWLDVGPIFRTVNVEVRVGTFYNKQLYHLYFRPLIGAYASVEDYTAFLGVGGGELCFEGERKLLHYILIDIFLEIHHYPQ